MKVADQSVKLTTQHIRFLKLLYKFRFVNATLLASVIGIRSDTTYKVLEKLVQRKLVTKVYKKEYRIDRRPAYYYLNKTGVTQVRKLLDVKEPVVHALYKNDQASDDFIQHCQVVLGIYCSLKLVLPPGTDIFTKTEINRFRQFPKNRPDLYVRTPSNKEALIVVADNMPNYIVNKRLEEIISHNEDEGWEGHYPTIAFILKDQAAEKSFIYKANQKLEAMCFDENELTILASSLSSIASGRSQIWQNVCTPTKQQSLF